MRLLERIMDATELLLDGRDFSQIPVSEICAEARVSDSSFYARFETKDALIRALHDRHVRRRRLFISGLVEDVDWASLSLREVVRRCLRLYLEDRAENSRLLQSSRLAQVQHRTLRDQRQRLDHDTMTLIESYFCNRLGRDSEALRRRIRFATHSAVAALHDSVASPHVFAEHLRMSHDEVLDLATDQWICFVGEATWNEALRSPRGGDERAD